ncbi:YbhB/YbcL family Raf kinase inhibitor-like protein [Halomicroarcula limicola]|uniref:YbhB/YbcL family Raf kinase inhibitor-like protein n=1 Tax=Haloarcula limicola TaxID=1429915 RepID=A0A8J7YAN2_9EURY|nr:YbhB/YbcL family Raf kinase inhibitor-like protein [Halomicroarcula limicola]MBV0925126.1 YbhB/YbcL family Raf kinase inhibitor-like protein [Halomicroarcula limicola]
MRRRRLLATAGATLGALSGCVSRADESRPLRVDGPGEDDHLPARYTCDGAGVSPPFAIQHVPEPTAGLAIVAESNRDAIIEPVRWALWNVPSDRARIRGGLPRKRVLDGLGGARQGLAPDGEPGYAAPCPAAGTTQSYRFQVYALERRLDLPPDVKNDDALDAINAATLSSARFVLRYDRPATEAETD